MLVDVLVDGVGDELVLPFVTVGLGDADRVGDDYLAKVVLGG